MKKFFQNSKIFGIQLVHPSMRINVFEMYPYHFNVHAKGPMGSGHGTRSITPSFKQAIVVANSIVSPENEDSFTIYCQDPMLVPLIQAVSPSLFLSTALFATPNFSTLPSLNTSTRGRGEEEILLEVRE